MPAPTNLSFETAGTGPGAAASWTFAVTSTAEEIADYATSSSPSPPVAPWEQFEGGWTNDDYVFAYEPSDLQHAEYDTLNVSVKQLEDFEELWLDNQSFMRELPGTVEAVEFNYHIYVETFDLGWESDVNNFKTEFDGIGVDLEVGLYDSGANLVEAFDGWAPGYITEFDPDADLFRKLFSTFTASAENFEYVRFRTPAGTDPVFDNITAVGHPFADGDRITFEADIYPRPLQANQAYYVAFAGTDDFQIELGVGAGAIDITETPVGQLYILADPATYWLEKLTSI